MRIIDISQELYGCAVYPGDPAPERKVLLSTAKGDACNLTALSLCAHNGTHLDAPFHFLEEGLTVDRLDLNAAIGPCYVAGPEGDVTAEAARAILERAGAAGHEAAKRILIKGKAVVTEGAAEVFARAGVLLLGSESQTVGPEDAPMRVHLILLGAGVLLLEGVRLAEAEEGAYFLSAAPLNLAGGDGAPCRAVLLDGLMDGPEA